VCEEGESVPAGLLDQVWLVTCIHVIQSVHARNNQSCATLSLFVMFRDAASVNHSSFLHNYGVLVYKCIHHMPRNI
jgi:hypothetical protein